MNALADRQLPRAVWILIAAALAGLGWAVVNKPVLAAIAVALALAALALSLANLSLTAGGLAAVCFIHLAGGQFYVNGVLPDNFPAALDALTAVLFVMVALRPNPRAPRSHAVTAAFIVLGLLAALNPLVPSVTFAGFGLRQLLLPVAALLVAKEAQLSRRDLNFILLALATGWAINVGVALRQWVFGFTGTETSWIQSQDATYLVGDQIRLMGATQSNQDFAFMCCIAVPAMVAYYFSAGKGWARRALGVLLLLSLAVLFGSLIRSTLVGGLVGAIVTAVAVTAASTDKARVLGYATGVVGVMLLLSVLAPAILPANKVQTLTERAGSVFNPGADPSFQQRGTRVWPQVVRTIGDNPLGGGPGSAGPVSQSRKGEAPFGAVIPDNGYLLMGVQLGILGALLFVGMFVTWVRDLWQRARLGSVAAAGAVGGVVGLMVAMLAGSYWSLIDPSVVFGVVVGLGLRGQGQRGVIDAQVGPASAEPEESATGAEAVATVEPPASPPVIEKLPPPRAGAPMTGPRLLVVAAPMVSAGGVYSYLNQVLPVIQSRGWPVGLVWSARVEVDDLPADWDLRIAEESSLRRRQRAIQVAVKSGLRDWRPDLVVSMLPQSDVACAATVPASGLPWVAMLHGSPYPRGGEASLVRRGSWRATEALALRRADAIVTVSEALARDSQQALGLPTAPLNVGSGVVVPPARAPEPRSTAVLGYVGRLAPEKAPEVFVEVARLLGRPARVFGDGPLAGQVGAAAARNPMLEHPGWTARDDAFAQIDLLVLPSLREALPLTVLEAGARSICVVARDVGGVGEVLRPDPEVARRCLLPATATPQDFAAACRPLLDDAELRAELGARLHRVVVERYSLEGHVDRLLDALQAHARTPSGEA